MVTTETKSTTQVKREIVRARAFLLAAFLLPLNTYWVGWMEAVTWAGHPTTYSLYFNTVLVLLALYAINELSRKVFGFAFLNRVELLLIYFVLNIGSTFVGHDQSQVLLSIIGHVHYYKGIESRYEELVMPNLPSWLVVVDESSLRELYMGNSSVWLPHNFLTWLKPLAWWWLFWLAMVAMFLGFSVLLIPQWARHEKLTFPLARLTLQITEPSLFRSHLFWLGFFIPTFVNTFNNLHALYPFVPEMHTHRLDLGAFGLSHPWSAIGWTPINFFPFAVGLGFLLPLDLLFSCWFFYWFWKAQRVLVAALGYPAGGIGNPPYQGEQAFGAYLGLATISIWVARHYLWQSLKINASAMNSQEFVVSPRWAWFLAAIGFFVLVAFSIVAGMQWWVAILFFIGYLFVSITVSRSRAEFGSPAHDLHHTSPGTVMVMLLGTKPFTPKTLTVTTLYYWFNRAQRSHPMPTAMEGLMLLSEKFGQGKPMWLATWLATLLGIPLACYLLLEPYYRLGAATAKVVGMQAKFGIGDMGCGWEAFHIFLLPWLSSHHQPNKGAFVFTVGGFLFSWLLHFLRMRFIGSPFHPLGYAVSGYWSMEMLWFPFFLAWLAKAMVLRYGSQTDYYRVSHFFLGLLIGDFVSGGLWTLYAMFLGRALYHFNE